MDNKEKYVDHKEIKFDLSILTDRSKHDGFFLVLPVVDGKTQVHFDKMDSKKFSTVVTAVIDIALANDVRNADYLIQELIIWKKKLEEIENNVEKEEQVDKIVETEDKPKQEEKKQS